MTSPGGFVWWYADLLDADGNGVVLIPSWGLPFLPGYTSGATRASGSCPEDRPALAVSIYERGRPAYYLLQEVSSTRAHRRGHTLEIGDSTFRFAPGSLKADLDLAAPGGRLVGTVRVTGVPRLGMPSSPLTHDDHEWSPLVGPATGSWDLSAGGQTFSGSGSAYLDRNAGRGSLSALGIARWTWCRTQLPDRLRIGYALWPEQGEVQAVLVDVLADGRTEAHRASITQEVTRRNLWGLPWWSHLTLTGQDRTMSIRVTHRPDDGPFYQRNIAQVRTEVGQAIGLGEVCQVDRIDTDRIRPLVSMCVHRPQGTNHPMVQFFSGPRRGRLARLLCAA